MKNYLIVLSIMISSYGICQSPVKQLTNRLLNDTPIEEDLQELCDQVGGRITGSKANIASVQWAKSKFDAANVAAYLQPFEMPVKWLPGTTQITITDGQDIEINPLAVSKYMSPPGEYTGDLLYISDIDHPDPRVLDQVEGQFILVESDLCLDIAGLFAEYTMAAKVEALAYKYGAQGIIFMASRPQKLLYTFISSQTSDNKIPHLILSREDAKRCIRLIESGKSLRADIVLDPEIGGSFTSHNVIGEIPGSDLKDEVIIIGAHLDSWALGTGANDNGCNVSMLIDIARQMQALSIRPRRTIRFALWNGEEQGYFGSWAYTLDQGTSLDKHKMALSVDIGSGAITGFFTNGRPELMETLDRVLEPVSQFGPFTHLDAPIVGTDNFDFMLQGVPNLVGNHLPQVYGLNYHAQSDTYDKVDLESLKHNSAIVAALTLGLANAELSEEVWYRQDRDAVQKIVDEHDLEFTMRMFNVWESWIDRSRGINN